MLRELVVGERMNSDSRAGWYSLSKGVSRWARVSRSIGAFRAKSHAAKLLRVGVDLRACDSMNMLPPSKKAGAWDDELAESVAAFLLAEVANEYSVVYLCGRRVCDSFAWPGEFGDAMTFDFAAGWDYLLDRRPLFVALPHPSGRCRVWNDAGDVAWVKAGVRLAKKNAEALEARSG